MDLTDDDTIYFPFANLTAFSSFRTIFSENDFSLDELFFVYGPNYSHVLWGPLGNVFGSNHSGASWPGLTNLEFVQECRR